MGLREVWGEHMKVKFDIQRFINLIREDESRYIFSTEDVLWFIVDSLCDAGIDAELKYQDNDFIVIVYGEEAQISCLLDSSDAPENALVGSLEQLVDEINRSKTQSAWYSYRRGEHFVSFEEKKTEKVARATL